MRIVVLTGAMALVLVAMVGPATAQDRVLRRDAPTPTLRTERGAAQAAPQLEPGITPLDVSDAEGEPVLLPDSRLVGRIVSSLNPAHLTLLRTSRMTVTFVAESANQRNVFGWYAVDHDGTIMSPEVIWANASSEVLVADQAQVQLGRVPRGARLGFFLVADGYGRDADIFQRPDLSDGFLEFRNASGRQATITDPTPQLVFIDSEGNELPVTGRTYHSATDGQGLGNLAINPDAVEHVRVGGDPHDDQALRISFEDMSGLGDRDFDDLVVSVRLVR